MTTFVPAPLTPAVETLNKLIQEVREMPRGGDLEGLIETRLADLERQCMDLALDQRQQAAEPEAFPPSGLPPVSEAVAPRSAQATHDPDAAR